MKDGVALVVPEVNPQDALDAKGIIASPNCSTTQMVDGPEAAARRVARRAGHRQHVSGHQRGGRAGHRDLIEGTQAQLAGEDTVQGVQASDRFQRDPADRQREGRGLHQRRDEDGLRDPQDPGDDPIQISATCVRIPVSNCHSESITVETERPIPSDEARELFANSRASRRRRHDGRSIRCRRPATAGRSLHRPHPPRPVHPNGLTFWCVSDNLRKGAATNAVQIAELLAKHRART